MSFSFSVLANVARLACTGHRTGSNPQFRYLRLVLISLVIWRPCAATTPRIAVALSAPSIQAGEVIRISWASPLGYSRCQILLRESTGADGEALSVGEREINPQESSQEQLDFHFPLDSPQNDYQFDVVCFRSDEASIRGLSQLLHVSAFNEEQFVGEKEGLIPTHSEIISAYLAAAHPGSSPSDMTESVQNLYRIPAAQASYLRNRSIYIGHYQDTYASRSTPELLDKINTNIQDACSRNFLPRFREKPCSTFDECYKLCTEQPDPAKPGSVHDVRDCHFVRTSNLAGYNRKYDTEALNQATPVEFDNTAAEGERSGVCMNKLKHNLIHRYVHMNRDSNFPVYNPLSIPEDRIFLVPFQMMPGKLYPDTYDPDEKNPAVARPLPLSDAEWSVVKDGVLFYRSESHNNGRGNLYRGGTGKRTIEVIEKGIAHGASVVIIVDGSCYGASFLSNGGIEPIVSALRSAAGGGKKIPLVQMWTNIQCANTVHFPWKIFTFGTISPDSPTRENTGLLSWGYPNCDHFAGLGCGVLFDEAYQVCFTRNSVGDLVKATRSCFCPKELVENGLSSLCGVRFFLNREIDFNIDISDSSAPSTMKVNFSVEGTARESNCVSGKCKLTAPESEKWNWLRMENILYPDDLEFQAVPPPGSTITAAQLESAGFLANLQVCRCHGKNLTGCSAYTLRSHQHCKLVCKRPGGRGCFLSEPVTTTVVIKMPRLTGIKDDGNIRWRVDGSAHRSEESSNAEVEIPRILPTDTFNFVITGGKTEGNLFQVEGIRPAPGEKCVCKSSLGNEICWIDLSQANITPTGRKIVCEVDRKVVSQTSDQTDPISDEDVTGISISDDSVLLGERALIEWTSPLDGCIVTETYDGTAIRINEDNESHGQHERYYDRLGTYRYVISCPDSIPVVATVTVEPRTPVLDLAITPSSVPQFGEAAISWSALGVRSCEVYKDAEKISEMHSGYEQLPFPQAGVSSIRLVCLDDTFSPMHRWASLEVIRVAPPLDTDSDGVEDRLDNCPLKSNTDQLDSDNDQVGNACDDDLDNDSYSNSADNCSATYNPHQADADGDGVGDACDTATDPDGDTILTRTPGAGWAYFLNAQTGQEYWTDNCPLISNITQLDTDGDGAGDACDSDDDNIE